MISKLTNNQKIFIILYALAENSTNLNPAKEKKMNSVKIISKI